MAVELQVAVIYAVVNNLLADIKIEDIKSFERELCEYLTAAKKELLDSIVNTGNLTDETTKELREAIIACKEKFLGRGI